MKANKKSLLLGIFIWACFVVISFIMGNRVFPWWWLMVGISFSTYLILCLTFLLSRKYKDGTEIPFKSKIEWCINLLWVSSSAGLVCLFGFFFLERYEKERSRERELVTYSPRSVTVKTAFGSNDSIKLQILTSWEHSPFEVGEKVEISRTFWSGDNSLNKVTRDIFVSPSVDHGINDISISRHFDKKDFLFERISIQEVAAYCAYRYVASKEAVVIHDAKSD